MIKDILPEIKQITKMFVQYLFSFSFPVLCILMPIVLFFAHLNPWMLFLYIITIPAFVVQRDMINKYKIKNKNYCDFWGLKFWDSSTWW